MEATAPMSIVQSTVYAIQRSTIGFSRMISSPAFFRVIKLTMTKNRMPSPDFVIVKNAPAPSPVGANTSFTAFFIPTVVLMLKNVQTSCGSRAIPCITRTAAPTFSARKKIHANETRQNVITTLTIAGIRHFSCNGFVARPTHWYNPWIKPQATKCQPAPCQTPLTKKVSIRFRWILGKATRLPPSGMYI